MNYQGTTNVQLDLDAKYVVEFSIDLVEKASDYDFDILNLRILDATTDTTVSLSSVGYELQKHLIESSNERIDEYISEHAVSMLHEQASDAFLRRLDKVLRADMGFGAIKIG